MNPVAHTKLSKPDSLCPDLVTMAERELSAFFHAITQLFGSEQAKLSAQDWLQELIESDGLPTSIREWRLLTAKVSTRLANHAEASPLSPALQIA